MPFVSPTMEPKASRSSARWLTQLCRELEACKTVEDIQPVLDDLDISIILTEVQLESVLNQLASATETKFLVEVVLSSGSWCKALSTWLLERFPKSPDSFAGTIHGTILDLLDLVPGSEETYKYVRLVLKALQLMATFTGEMRPAQSTDGSISFGMPVVRSNRPRQKQAEKTFSLNPLELKRLDINLPETKDQALGNAEELLGILNVQLQEYLEIMQSDKGVINEIQRLFVQCVLDKATSRAKSSKNQTATRPEVDLDLRPDEEAIYEELLSSPTMKASLYFPSAPGLGPWRILLGNRTYADLRAIQRADSGKTFKAVIKRIVELSNGRFSHANMKRINSRRDRCLPVYEARLPGDRRLIYRIDCTPDYHSVVFLKLLGIYSHKEVKRRLWTAVGIQLAGKGKEYLRRCTLRHKSSQASDDRVLPENFSPSSESFLPESFPPLSGNVEEEVILPELPKEEMEEEKEIVEHPYSCYVIGRSGTGKTTTMLFKMLGIERAYAQELESSTPESITKPRQLFITKSHVLAKRVEEYFTQLLESLSIAKKSKEELQAIADARKAKQKDQHNTVSNLKDDVTWKARVPERYSALQDHHFPLFLTFEQLSHLLEGDLEGLETSSGNFVTYDIFLKDYWPHFPLDLTKALDPALVFGEMIGVIEGSELSLSHEARYLSQHSYYELSCRANHTFARQREKVYSLFAAYVQRKQQNGAFDSADRSHRILKALEEVGVPGARIDYLYVDEVQDNLLIDAMLLRSLCRNPNGLFWAGDTAQTIAVGSSFRFDDLKAFLYRLEQRRKTRSVDDSAITQSELRTFQLVVNHRSHSGIVRCASAVIALITEFWPYAIDNLSPERGIVGGAKPMFFTGWETDAVQYDQFLVGKSGERVEFGAQQCILVRDEIAKAELRQRVGTVGFIFTLYESKGLEFDDVLLYKFFEDSKIDASQWRVVLNMVERPTGSTYLPAPRFDEERHAGVCSELKFLYVAITRSRKNLWIVDFSERAEPMRRLWDSKGLIQNFEPGGDIPHLATMSTPEEWAARGSELMDKDQYGQAKYAFDRAGPGYEIHGEIAYAYQFRENVGRMQAGRTQRDAFRSAAELFLQCALRAEETDRRISYHNAAGCYEEAAARGGNKEDCKRAAKGYNSAGEYVSAIKLYQRGDMFLEAVDVVRQHRDDDGETAELAENTFEQARLFYFKAMDLTRARSLFDSDKEMLAYLKLNPSLSECYAKALVGQGKYWEAAEVHAQDGRIVVAVRILRLDKKNPESAKKANEYILQGLWQHCSFTQKVKKADTNVLLDLASLSDASLLSQTQKDEFTMFENLKPTRANDTTIFRTLAYRFLQRKERPQALLSFDHFFTTFPSISNVSNSDLPRILEDFHTYARVFKNLIVTLDITDLAIQKLFGFTSVPTKGAYRLRNGTWIHQRVSKSWSIPSELDDGTLIVQSAHLQEGLTSELWYRLQARLSAENDACQRAPVFNPCIAFIMSSYRCPCSGNHLRFKDLTPDWYTMQLRIHALQISLFHLYSSIPLVDGKDTVAGRRYWIHKLFETMWPATHHLGFQAIRVSGVADKTVARALLIVRCWSHDILHTHKLANGEEKTLLTFFYEAAFLSLFADRKHAESYLAGAPLVSAFEATASRNKGEAALLPELYQCLLASDGGFISAGILFLRQFTESRDLQIDVNTLCHLAEYLSAALILARMDFNLHNLTLPRGWLLFFLRHVTVTRVDTTLITDLLEALKCILESLVYGGEKAKYLVHADNDLSFARETRCLFILRMSVLPIVSSFGYNIPNSNLREDILNILKVLDGVTMRHSPFRRFIGRTHWGGVCLAVEASSNDSRLDYLVQMCLDGQGSTQNLPHGLHRVLFTSKDDAIAKLSTLIPVEVAEPTVDRVAIRPPVMNAKVAEAKVIKPKIPAAKVVESKDVKANEGLKIEKRTRKGSKQPGVGAFNRPKDDASKVAAAKFLTARYRAILRSRSMAAGKSRAQKSCDAYFKACLSNLAYFHWPERCFYRVLYLGLVPHILACLKALESLALAKKIKTREQMHMGSVEHDNLDNQRTELGNIMKFSKRLSGKLDPASETHKQQDIDLLCKLVGEVEDLVKRMPSVTKDILFHLAIVVNALARRDTVRESQPQPTEISYDSESDMQLGGEGWVFPAGMWLG
ncbi:hypothetical protein DFP72DRAFT_865003 [Ephemerocybe angulata]|uniref:UvrD-like helicase ATP-binding domain-containing protein n=1 Tax=Ephemerocybe angulata TaxID=980116 RepID=A0A8H6II52_9AGAR|nr:hypothetical protein DFP72DRAFT_865003 [Tulosesus angulatus]